MYKNFRRLLVIYRGARRPFIVSQALLAISVLLNLAIVALNGTLVNEGVQQGNIRVVISTSPREQPTSCAPAPTAGSSRSPSATSTASVPRICSCA
jgi:hypothetical protein